MPPYDGSGVFNVYTPGTPFVTGTTISSTVANNVNSDFATGLSTAITKDGQTTPTANIPMGGFKLTGLGAGTANGNSVRFEQLAAVPQDGLPTYLTSVSGTNTVIGTATPTPTLAVGQRYVLIPTTTNTGATTLNISSTGAGAVQWAGAALTGGEFVAGTPVTVVVTAVTPVFEIVNATQFPDTRALVVGGTDATKKLRFEVDGFTTATTRVATPPNADFTMARIDAAQTFAGTQTFSGLIDATNGQIQFPAAQNPSANANTLDDYEEGTWTPADGSGAGLSLTVTSARYVKIGQLVFISFDVTYPATASGAIAVISGLPFTNQATNGGGGTYCFASASLEYHLMVQSSSTTIYISGNNGAGATNAQLTGSIVRFSCTYRATA